MDHVLKSVKPMCAAVALLGAVALVSCEQAGSGDTPATTASTTEQPETVGVSDARQGVEAESASLKFDVKGMTCMGCVNSVINAINGVDGVVSCDVSLEDKQAVVEAESPELIDAIIKAIEEADFDATHQPS